MLRIRVGSFGRRCKEAGMQDSHDKKIDRRSFLNTALKHHLIFGPFEQLLSNFDTP
jgi:hypothetical protein